MSRQVGMFLWLGDSNLESLPVHQPSSDLFFRFFSRYLQSLRDLSARIEEGHEILSQDSRSSVYDPNPGWHFEVGWTTP
jgi:hypothetical protein